jgi:hypothetical protein
MRWRESLYDCNTGRLQSLADAQTDQEYALDVLVPACKDLLL